MPKEIPPDSMGIVKPEVAYFEEPIELDCGRSLPKYHITYETYGTLNADKSNALLICHALSGDHHAAGYHHMDDRKPGWWNNYIGPGKPIDTNRFFVICSNNIGSCRGSTGPNTMNPDTKKPYGPNFPIITVRDWVKTQHRLGRYLGIDKWAAVIGGSLGGMQALQWAIDYPDDLRHCVVIAAAPKLTAQNIAFNEVARQAILSDPEFYEGHFYEKGVIPHRGLMLARMLGHITYLSDVGMRQKFGRELKEGKLNYGFDEAEFQIESYLRYQGRSFVERSGFDANTYLLMTKALDYFDPASEHEHHLGKALAHVKADFFVLSFTSDWRFSPARSEEIVRALTSQRKNVSYMAIRAHDGHDAFLIPNPVYRQVFQAYMQRV